jgi:hypothetical protein
MSGYQAQYQCGVLHLRNFQGNAACINETTNINQDQSVQKAGIVSRLVRALSCISVSLLLQCFSNRTKVSYPYKSTHTRGTNHPPSSSFGHSRFIVECSMFHLLRQPPSSTPPFSPLPPVHLFFVLFVRSRGLSPSVFNPCFICGSTKLESRQSRKHAVQLLGLENWSFLGPWTFLIGHFVRLPHPRKSAFICGSTSILCFLCLLVASPHSCSIRVSSMTKLPRKRIPMPFSLPLKHAKVHNAFRYPPFGILVPVITASLRSEIHNSNQFIIRRHKPVRPM